MDAATDLFKQVFVMVSWFYF